MAWVIPKFTGELPPRAGRPTTVLSAPATKAAAPATKAAAPRSKGAAAPRAATSARPAQRLAPKRQQSTYTRITSDEPPAPPLLDNRAMHPREEQRRRDQEPFRDQLFLSPAQRAAKRTQQASDAWRTRQRQANAGPSFTERVETAFGPAVDSYVRRTTSNPIQVLTGGGYSTPSTPRPRTEGTTAATPVLGQQGDFRRSGALLNSTELTQQQYEALSTRQQAAIQFNTGLTNAARADHKKRDGSTANTEKFLESMGITPRSEAELNRYLNLDMLISPSTIAAMDDPANGVQKPTSSMGHVAGEITPQQQAVTDARRHSEIVAKVISQRLGQGGTYREGSAPLPGFGNTPTDVVIQDAYLQIIDSSKDWTTKEVVAGIAEMNAQAGTDVTPQQVWDFTRANLQSVEFGSLGSRKEQLRGAGFDLNTGIELVPADVAAIRERYGI